MRKDIKITNRPLHEYMKYNHYIIFKDLSIDINSIIKTNILALSTLKHVQKNNLPFKIGIHCSPDYSKWIHPLISYINLKNLPSEPIGLYKIIHYSYLSTNHHEIANQLKIEYPLDIKGFFNKNKSKNKNSILLAFSNFVKYLEIPHKVEKNIYTHFNNIGYEVNIAAVPNINYSNSYWGKEKLKYSKNILDLINLIEEHNIIISGDNSILSLANNFLNKKVIGLFGPSIPNFLTKYNSLRFIQIKDNNILKDKRVVKSCACINPKMCHRGYISGQYPYCFNNIDSISLIREIESIINI